MDRHWDRERERARQVSDALDRAGTVDMSTPFAVYLTKRGTMLPLNARPGSEFVLYAAKLLGLPPAQVRPYVEAYIAEHSAGDDRC